MSFLPDGRFIGTPGPPSSVRPAGVDRCRRAGAGDRPELEPIGWPLTIEVADGAPDVGIFISTDTGYAPDGVSTSSLDEGVRIPLQLHPDTTVLGVTHETSGVRARSVGLRLPAVVTAALASGDGCAVWRHPLVLHLARDLRARLEVEDTGRAC
jgi:hypothetical protein